MELISAIATPQGRGGIAVVRVSGDGATEIARKMFCRAVAFAPNRMYAGEIDCGSVKDYGLCVCFRAPKSFTGEDVVEFHLHGGAEIARAALGRTLELGARLAGRGEFTRRAFLNGKLSLSAAEGMADMINASSEAEVRAGYLLYGEKLTEEGKSLQARIKTCLASVEADVDYPEEDLTRDSRQEIAETLRETAEKLRALLAQYRAGKKIKEGVRVAFCGRPNAGKSTLFNALLGYDRAIVSPVAGTTRDTLEGEISIKGVRFLLTDTAGLRATSDEIEGEGVRRAERAISAADVIVWLQEEGDAPSFPEGTPVITVTAKSDLGRMGPGLMLSARTGVGLVQLKEAIYERGYGAANDGAYLMEERHYEAVRAAAACVDRALSAVEEGLPAELYAEDLRGAYFALGAIGGETATEDVIDEIFSKFCVGK